MAVRDLALQPARLVLELVGDQIDRRLHVARGLLRPDDRALREYGDLGDVLLIDGAVAFVVQLDLDAHDHAVQKLGDLPDLLLGVLAYVRPDLEMPAFDDHVHP
jgi:hypothetical protein